MPEEWTLDEYHQYLKTGAVPARFQGGGNSARSPRSEPHPGPGGKMSDGERAFFADVQFAGLPIPEREYHFHPERDWRFDFAWPDFMVAVEIEGGTHIFGGGRHNRADGFEEDCDKYNEAQYYGWVVLRFPTGQVSQKKALQTTIKHLGKKGWKP